MELWSTLKLSLRRWYIVLLVLAVIGPLGAFAWSRSRPTYLSVDTALLTVPPIGPRSPGQVRLPFGDIDNQLKIDVDALARIMHDQSQRKLLGRERLLDDYQLVLDPDLPAVRISVSGPDRAVVAKTASRVVEVMRQRLSELEDDAGAPPDQRIVLTVLEPKHAPAELPIRPIRLGLTFAALGWCIALGSALWWDRRKAGPPRREVPHPERGHALATTAVGAPSLYSTVVTRPRWSSFVVVVLALSLTVAILAPPVGLAVAVLGAVVLVVWTTKCEPDAFLSFWVLLVVLIPSPYVVGPTGAAGTPANLLALVGFAWWAYSRLGTRPSSAQGRQPLRIAVLAMLGIMLLAYGLGFTRPLDGVEGRSADRAALVLIALSGVALLAADGLSNRAGLDRLLRRLVLVTTVMAAIGIVQFTTGLNPAAALKLPGLQVNNDLASIGERSVFRRVAGTAVHGIEFGVVLTIVFPLALHYAFYSPTRSLVRRWGSVAVIAAAIPMAVSRSGVLGLIVGMVALWTTWSWRRRLNGLAVAVVFSGLMRSAFPGLLGTLKSLIVGASSDPSVTGRTDDYGSISQFLEGSRWLGRGLGTYLPDRYRYLDNQYIGTLIETGIIGLLALVLVLLVGLSLARGARRRAQDEATKHLAQALFASILVALCTFTTFDALSFPMNAGVCFLLLGCAGALWRLETYGLPEAPPLVHETAGSSTTARP